MPPPPVPCRQPLEIPRLTIIIIITYYDAKKKKFPMLCKKYENKICRKGHQLMLPCSLSGKPYTFRCREEVTNY